MTKVTASPRLIERPVIKILFGGLLGGLFVTVFFWTAGKFDWLRGWIYIVLLACGQGTSTFYVWWKDPELLRRRSEIGEGTKTWDKVLVRLFVVLYFVMLITAALDERLGWSAMSWWLWLVGTAMYIIFMIVLTWAMCVNPHFEKFVRIQDDRGHRVIDAGPYRIIRHPGYLAIILGFVLPVPFILGSWCAFVLAFLAVLCLVIRTAWEDRTLRKELSGYEDYTRRVRYRLLFGIW